MRASFLPEIDLSIYLSILALSRRVGVVCEPSSGAATGDEAVVLPQQCQHRAVGGDAAAAAAAEASFPFEGSVFLSPAQCCSPCAASPQCLSCCIYWHAVPRSRC
jgi:hypothetical protein